MRTAQIREVVEVIDGQAIVDDLLELAAIGGKTLEPTPDHPVHIAANRLALTEKDREARETFIAPRMVDAGMDVLDDHPLAVIGTFPGRNRELDPVVVLSHTDTVTDADIYDGNLGVLGGLAVVKGLHSLGLQTERDIMLVSLSGEESAPFNMALFGSRALFQGLTAAELDSRRDGGQSIREALGEAGTRWASQPVFGPNGADLPTPHAVIELHVEQDKKLIDAGVDLGVVDRIAAPARYQATVGESPLRVDAETYPHEQYLRLRVHGEADHSGATPMGTMHRADGLLETVHLLDSLLEEQDSQPVLRVGQIEVAEGVMNKIPGTTTTMLRIAGESEQEVRESSRRVEAALTEARNYHATMASRFRPNPFELERIEAAEAGVFFEAEAMADRQKAAFDFIKSVNRAAAERAHDNVVGTVATFETSDEGIITLKTDIRGIELDSRTATVAQIERDLETPALAEARLGDVLPGSGDSPVTLDAGLVDKALAAINEHGVGTVQQMFSAAGHDTQNAARAGIPSVMLFCQSKDGKAHNPDAYTSPANIQQGVRALAALVLRLANEVPGTPETADV